MNCILCGAEKTYAKNLCRRCYERLKKRRQRMRKKLEKTAIQRSVNLTVYENIGLECPHCKNTAEFHIDFERGEIICKICGVVLVSGSRFNTFFPHAEWRK